MRVTLEGDILNIVIAQTKPGIESKAGFEMDELSAQNDMGTSNGVWTIEVTHALTGVIQRAVTTVSGECQFDTSAWSAGIYLIHASNGTDSYTQKITIK